MLNHMETFYCEFCDKEKVMERNQWNRENSKDAYCYCTPAIPHMFRPGTRTDFQQEERKYKNIFK